MKRITSARITALTLLIIFAATAAFAARVIAVETVGFTVAEMNRSIAFYCDVLDFRKVTDSIGAIDNKPVRVVRLQLGDEQIELKQYLTGPGKPFPPGSRGNDRWFQHIAIITRDMDKAYARLRANRVRHASSAPQTLPDWNRNAAGIKAFYFRDPDGHFLEVLQFPPDKGLRKWHGAKDALFLGIDHTAIVVSDTDASLHLYRDELGMKIAGESDNYGVEQEHLNGVFGAHLRITSLRAPNGPGIELLEYLSPLDGRAYPADANASDLVHWETRLVTDNEPIPLTSNNTHAVTANVNISSEHTAKDPDGHVLILRPRANVTQAQQGGNQ
jgi:catechol 2,3-dioxygenase-like lactoylglutathione lyase family enzyme